MTNPDLRETIRARAVDWASGYNRLDSVRLREAKVLIDDCLTLLKAQEAEMAELKAEIKALKKPPITIFTG